MPETIDNKQVFSLTEVAQSIQKALENRYGTSFWVVAEMNKLNFYPHSGHCYPELTEKRDGKVVVLMRSVLWREDYERINGNFVNILKEPLKDGIKILCQARIVFDAMHGLQLRIYDIDPGYTLGDIEKERLATIARLKHENIFDANQKLRFPILPRRIAVISVETSKGYADFTRVLNGNDWNYAFFLMLFPSLLQGEKAVESIMYQLERIRTVAHHFDVVAIIRGGGGDVGLSCYNNFELSRAIACFPLPVLTGIGHATNETVSEMVAHVNAITPTKLAELLIQRYHNFSVPVENAATNLIRMTRQALALEKKQQEHTSRYLQSMVAGLLNTQRNFLNYSARLLYSGSYFRMKEEKLSYNLIKLCYAGQQYFSGKQTALSSAEKLIKVLDPVNVMRRGFSITMLNGKVLKQVSAVAKGDMLHTLLPDGSITSQIISTENSTNHEK